MGGSGKAFRHRMAVDDEDAHPDDLVSAQGHLRAARGDLILRSAASATSGSSGFRAQGGSGGGGGSTILKASSVCHSCRKPVEARGTNAGSCWHLVMGPPREPPRRPPPGSPPCSACAVTASLQRRCGCRIDHHCVAMMVTTPPTTERVTAVRRQLGPLFGQRPSHAPSCRSRPLPTPGSASDALLCRAPPTSRGQTSAFPLLQVPQRRQPWLPWRRFARKRPNGQGRSTESDPRRLDRRPARPGRQPRLPAVARTATERNHATSPRALARNNRPNACAAGSRGTQQAQPGSVPRQRWRKAEPRDRPTAGGRPRRPRSAPPRRRRVGRNGPATRSSAG